MFALKMKSVHKAVIVIILTRTCFVDCRSSLQKTLFNISTSWNTSLERPIIFPGNNVFNSTNLDDNHGSNKYLPSLGEFNYRTGNLEKYINQTVMNAEYSQPKQLANIAKYFLRPCALLKKYIPIVTNINTSVITALNNKMQKSDNLDNAHNNYPFTKNTILLDEPGISEGIDRPIEYETNIDPDVKFKERNTTDTNTNQDPSESDKSTNRFEEDKTILTTNVDEVASGKKNKLKEGSNQANTQGNVTDQTANHNKSLENHITSFIQDILPEIVESREQYLESGYVREISDLPQYNSSIDRSINKESSDYSEYTYSDYDESDY